MRSNQEMILSSPEMLLVKITEEKTHERLILKFSATCNYCEQKQKKWNLKRKTSDNSKNGAHYKNLKYRCYQYEKIGHKSVDCRKIREDQNHRLETSEM